VEVRNNTKEIESSIMHWKENADSESGLWAKVGDQWIRIDDDIELTQTLLYNMQE